MNHIGQLIDAMITYYVGDARRINHFLKVYGFAKTIGETEGLDKDTQNILEIAALTHDIGIKNSEKKYGDCSGTHQQIEGPPEAEKLLAKLDADPVVTGRVCWLIAHHHTYTDIQGSDYQILIEADFLVNIFEDDMPLSAIQSVRDKIFKTASGKKILSEIYCV